MKICILKEELCIGGTERSAANISKILAYDNEVIVAVYDDSHTEYSFGGKMVSFNSPAQNSVILKIKNNIFRIIKYYSLLQKENIDVAYEFISVNSPISAIKRKSCARIISARDFSVMVRYIRRFSCCLSNADAMICNSKYIKDYYLKHYPEHVDKVFTVYNIIDSGAIAQQAEESIEDNFNAFISSHTKVITSAGRFCREKGFEYLLEAFAEAQGSLPKLGLVLIGDGDYREKYDDIIKKYNIEKDVFFTGFQSNPYKYMKCCDAFVLSSLSEGFPNVLAEAMALSLPVISTNCFSGPAEILMKDCDYSRIRDRFEECDYGILTPCHKENKSKLTAEQLSRAIVFLLSNEDMMKKYSRLSGQRAKEFSGDIASKQLNKIFELLMQRRGAHDKKQRTT